MIIVLYLLQHIQSKDEESFVKQAFLISFDLHCNGKNSFLSHLMNMSEYFKLPDFNADLLDISNGNRTEWSPIRSIIIGRPRSGSPICLITRMITDRIGLQFKKFKFKKSGMVHVRT